MLGTSEYASDKPLNTWMEGISKHFKRLKECRDNHDVNIRIGESEILAHKIVLGANSRIMERGDCSFNTTTKMCDVRLDPQFDDRAELITEIIDGMYDPLMSELSLENTKVAFNFSIFYEVEWLITSLFARAQTILENNDADDLVELFKFAHLADIRKLKDICLDHVVPEVLGPLSRSGIVVALDFKSIRKLALSSQISEWYKFCLIRAWLEYDVPGRRFHFPELIGSLRFGDSGTPQQLEAARNWVLGIEWVVCDADKLAALVSISRMSKSTIVTPDVPDNNQPVLPLLPMDKVTNRVTSNGKTDKVEVDEFVNLLSQTSLEPVQKQMINEYIAMENKSILTEPLIIAHIVKSFLGSTSLLNPRVLFGDMAFSRQLIKKMIVHGDWKGVPFESVNVFVSAIREQSCTSSKTLVKLWVIETVMRWVKANAGSSHIPDVMSQLGKGDLCFCDLPAGYREMILMPYIEEVGGKITEECSNHANVKPPSSLVFELSSEMYSMKKSETSQHFCVRGSFYSQTGRCYESLSYNINMRLRPEKLFPLIALLLSNNPSKPAINTNYPSILFNKTNLLLDYPISSESRHTSNELRELFGSGFTDLCVMVNDIDIPK